MAAKKTQRMLNGPEFDLGSTLSRRTFLKTTVLTVAGLAVSSFRTLEVLAQEGKISLGEELSILQHASEDIKTLKSGLSCAPYHNNILSYVSKNGSRELKDMDRFFLRYNSHPSKAESVDEVVFNQNLLNRDGPAPFSTSFTWDRRKDMLAAYIVSRITPNDYELLHVKIGNSKRPKEIMPVCRIKSYIDNPECSSCGDQVTMFSGVSYDEKKILLLLENRSIKDIAPNKRFSARSKAVWNHTANKAEQMFAYVAMEKNTEREGVIFYKPNTKEFEFYPIGNEGKLNTCQELAFAPGNNWLYFHLADGLNLNILRDNSKAEILDQIDPRVRSISMAVSPKIGEEIFYIDQEKIRNRPLSCIKVAKPGSEPRILAKSNFPITELDIDCDGKYLYYLKNVGGDERGFYLKCRKIVRS